jgi:hypothetical protein
MKREASVRPRPQFVKRFSVEDCPVPRPFAGDGAELLGGDERLEKAGISDGIARQRELIEKLTVAIADDQVGAHRCLLHLPSRRLSGYLSRSNHQHASLSGPARQH